MELLTIGLPSFLGFLAVNLPNNKPVSNNADLLSIDLLFFLIFSTVLILSISFAISEKLSGNRHYIFAGIMFFIFTFTTIFFPYVRDGIKWLERVLF